MIILQQPPLRIRPLYDDGPYEGLFTPQWENWFLNITSVVQGRVIPASASFGGAFAGGGGAKDVQFTTTLQQDCTAVIHVAIIQTWVTAAPTWRLQINIDGTIVSDTGVIANSWQTTAALMFEVNLTKGAHTIHGVWTGGNANATLARLDVAMLPTLL